MRTATRECVIGGDLTSVIFGVDGVIIDSARTSAGAWKSVLDPFLRMYAATHETAFVPFDVRQDFLRHTYGKPRLAGVRDFLASRHISLPYDDLRGLMARQEEFFLAEVRRHGVSPYGSAVTLVRELHRRGVHTAAVSAQRYGADELRSAGVAGMFDVVLDGLDAPGTGLPAGPDTALFVQAALRLGDQPRRTAVIESTAAGVAAAQRGGFRLVVGVDRLRVAALAEHGADVVITDLSELRPTGRVHTA
jgi:beta-phosphoglucomutase-like phosphatase (HAD superfamily)